MTCMPRVHYCHLKHVPALFVQCVCNGLEGEGVGRVGVGAGVGEEGGEGEVGGHHLTQSKRRLFWCYRTAIEFSKHLQTTQSVGTE